ncbi:MFS transporter [Jeongeupia sp. USM3]|uniref:MFS transporter n=1 Tax=Jeongeupia sp. USM3 TaxID=1906741 RepID=UPI00089DF43B|nr:MFS transporter [Jeongeupia sp. USM3]AOY00751.1 MFS transporter [Jeongeupia sp. USM3]
MSHEPLSAPSGRFAVWLPLLILCLAQFLASADNVTLSIATGVLMRDLGASLALVSKANTMYPLVAGTFMVAGGMLGIMLGWKRTFRIGALIYLVAELCAALAPSMGFFAFVARTLAGIGGSFMIPAVFGLITSIYAGRRQAVAFGALGAASGVSFALGPIVCGLLLEGVGWRWAFGILAGVIVLILLCTPLIPTPPRQDRGMRFDLPGFVLSTLGLFLVVFGLLQVSAWGVLTPFAPPFTILGCSPALFLVAAGLAVLALMLRWERHREASTGSALIPRIFLQAPQVRAGLYLTAYIFFAYSSGIFVVVSFVQIVTGLDAIHTGLLIVPFAICLSACSLGLPVLITQRNQRRQCRAGLLLGIAGAVVTAAGIRGEGFSTAIVVAGLCLIGASMGTIAANAPFLVTSALPERDAQQSGGVQAAARDIGQALGVAMVSMVMLTAVTVGMKRVTGEDMALSTQARAVVTRLAVIPFTNDGGFRTLMAGAGVPSADLPSLARHYRASRVRGAQAGILAMALMTLLFLLATRRIPGGAHKRG